jgi:hypothetical protein
MASSNALCYLITTIVMACVSGGRVCRNPLCSEAISIVRAQQDYTSPAGDFAFNKMATFSVLSKDGLIWEGNVSST